MRRGSKRGNHRPYRGRGGFSSRQTVSKPPIPPPAPASPVTQKPSVKPTPKERFGKSDTMATAKSMLHSSRQKALRAEDEEFLGVPPPNLDLIECRIVLPGEHLLPAGLDEPGALDDIRKIYKVYIMNIKPHVLSVKGKHMTRLQQALVAISWAIHDMRLSNEHPPTQFFVQEPTNGDTKSMVRVEIGSRPFFTARNVIVVENLSAMDNHLPRLSTDMAPSADTLMALNKNMKMRVNFGQVNIRSRNTRGRNEIPYDELVNMMGLYSHRGGASLETRLSDTKKAEKIIQYLIDPERGGICDGSHRVAQNYEVTMTVQGQEVKTMATTPINQRYPQLSMVHATKPEAWGRLNWTVAAPDMQYDWNLQVDAWDDVDTPAGFSDIQQKLQIIVEDSDDVLCATRLNTQKLGALQAQVDQLRLKTSVTLPYKASSYIIEVNVTKAWKGANTADKPEITWGVELYAGHWDGSINRAHGSERRKDWGEGYKNIWPGDEPGLEVRFGDFIRTILEVQALLEEAHSHMSALTN